MASPSIPLKQCTRREKCVNPLGSWLPATTEYFNLNNKARDGFYSLCKECRKAYREQKRDHIYQQKKRWRENNPDKERERVQRWRAENAEYVKEKKHGDYLSNREAIHAQQKVYRARNIDRIKQKERERYQKNRNDIVQRERAKRDSNPDLRKAAVKRSRKWRLANQARYRMLMKSAKARRRALESAALGTHTADDIQKQYVSQKGRCWHCGEPLGDTYHADHLVPLSRGGSNDARNIVLACATCNLSKNNRMTWEWNGRLL